MPKFSYTEDDVVRFDLIKAGIYPCEVADFASELCNTGDTNGCNRLSLGIKFYTDESFSKPVAKWTEKITFPEVENLHNPQKAQDLNRFLAGLLNMFVKSFNFLMDGKPPNKGQDIELTEETVLGLRGWALVSDKPKKKEDPKGDRRNYVKEWVTTGKPKLARVKQEQEDKPF